MEVSLYSFFGLSSPTTTKIRGKIGKANVIILIDSGDTHNFVSPAVVKRARLQTSKSSKFTVMVGIGLSVHSSEICKKTELQLQSVVVTTYFIVLEPGSADVILGVQWLRTLGKCKVDWQNQVLSFMTKTCRVTLYGDVLTDNMIQDQSAECSGIDWDGTIVTMFTVSADEKLQEPHKFHELLQKFKAVFAEPISQQRL